MNSCPLNRVCFVTMYTRLKNVNVPWMCVTYVFYGYVRTSLVVCVRIHLMTVCFPGVRREREGGSMSGSTEASCVCDWLEKTRNQEWVTRRTSGDVRVTRKAIW